MAVLVTYGSSQARGGIGATAEAYATTTPDLSCIHNLHHSLQQCQKFNSLSKARGQTRILTELGWVLNPLNHRGTPKLVYLFLVIIIFI